MVPLHVEYFLLTPFADRQVREWFFQPAAPPRVTDSGAARSRCGLGAMGCHSRMESPCQDVFLLTSCGDFHHVYTTNGAFERAFDRKATVVTRSIRHSMLTGFLARTPSTLENDLPFASETASLFLICLRTPFGVILITADEATSPQNRLHLSRTRLHPGGFDERASHP
jgi:hypothetical protein